MKTIGLIFWKEFRSYFISWMAYAILAFWLFMTGLLFWLVISRPDQFSLDPVYRMLITVLLFVAPLIAMRLIAEERSQGTMEMLLTSPVTEWQLALGKFLAAWGFVAAMLVLTAHLPLFSLRYGSLDTGPLWGSYLALLLTGAAFMAFGLFCSSLTESQLVAGFLTFGGLLLSWMLNWPASALPGNNVAEFVSYWSVFSHFEQLMRGAVDTKDVIFFVSFTLFFLFATVRVLESRKWR